MTRWGTIAALAVTIAGTSLPITTSGSTAVASAGCPSWHMHTIASGLGTLESLLPDGHGGMLLSSTTNDAVERLTRSGTVTVLATAPSPGQLVWHGKDRVLFPTGDIIASGLAGKTDGTLDVLNIKTTKVTSYAAGLTMPNGLAVGRGGDAYVTRDVGAGTGITRIGGGRHHKVTTKWASVSDTNGIAIDRKNTTMYVDQTFVANAPIVAISLQHPHQTHTIGDLSGLGSPVFKGLDDLIMGPHGVLYLPANLSGEVFSYDPHTKRACLLARGLSDPSAIAVGTGHGWKKGSLFVSGFDGTVRELDPAKQ
jgi:hypothetical protein